MAEKVAVSDPDITTNGKPKELRIEIDLDKFELEDLEVLDMSRVEMLPNGTVRPVTSMRVIIDVLDRLVVGGVRGKGYKGTQFWDIFRAVSDAIGAGMNPVGKNGKN